MRKKKTTVPLDVVSFILSARPIDSNSFYFTNRFHVAVRLFSNRSQMTSKCGKNKKVATSNLFVLYIKKIKIHEKNALSFQISPL